MYICLFLGPNYSLSGVSVPSLPPTVSSIPQVPHVPSQVSDVPKVSQVSQQQQQVQIVNQAVTQSHSLPLAQVTSLPVVSQVPTMAGVVETPSPGSVDSNVDHHSLVVDPSTQQQLEAVVNAFSIPAIASMTSTMPTIPSLPTLPTVAPTVPTVQDVLNSENSEEGPSLPHAPPTLPSPLLQTTPQSAQAAPQQSQNQPPMPPGGPPHPTIPSVPSVGDNTRVAVRPKLSGVNNSKRSSTLNVNPELAPPGSNGRKSAQVKKRRPGAPRKGHFIFHFIILFFVLFCVYSILPFHCFMSPLTHRSPHTTNVVSFILIFLLLLCSSCYSV